MNELNLLSDSVFPGGYPVVFFHAHPDDEAFLSAGLINELIKSGRECLVLYGAAAIVDGVEKTALRQSEAKKSCELLSISSALFLEFCEPKYSQKDALPLINQKIKRISDSMFAALNKKNIKLPLVLVSYDKNGGYGNPDHRLIHLAGRHFQKKYKAIVKSFIEITINRDKVNSWLSGAKNRLTQKSLPKVSYWSNEFGLPARKITHCYRLTKAQLALKRHVLAVHKSQVIQDEFPLSLSEEDFVEIFGCEFFTCLEEAK